MLKNNRCHDDCSSYMYAIRLYPLRREHLLLLRHRVVLSSVSMVSSGGRVSSSSENRTQLPLPMNPARGLLLPIRCPLLHLLETCNWYGTNSKKYTETDENFTFQDGVYKRITGTAQCLL